MVKKILNDYQRSKEDNSDDSIFYAQPRFVHHLDEGFRTRLTQLYSKQISTESVILDLMSSWVSHLPPNIKYKRVIGHGLNEKELQQNIRLDSFWIQDLNKNFKMPLQDSSIDVCLMVAAWQYLQYPEEIALELNRVIRPKGQLIISFSNRAFWNKSPRIWVESSDIERINYINQILISQGWEKPKSIFERTRSNGIIGLMRGEGDPFLSVIATNK